MGWLSTIFVALLCAIVGGLAAGTVAMLAVDWYRISSFEGKSGFFVVGVALLGAMAAFAVGLIVSRVVAAGANPGALKAVGIALAVIVGVALVAGLVARQLADVPPRLQGETLLLALELRWPEGQALPDAEGATWALRLRSTSGGVVRATQEGPLWREDARQEEDRWIVPGAVEVFTSRGGRSIDFAPEGLVGHGFLVPLPARPGTAQLAWSEWLPRAPDGEPPLPEGFRYRFRVVPTNEPIRRETFGNFEIGTIATGFDVVSWGPGQSEMMASAEFAVRHRSTPVVIDGAFERFEQVAALPGSSSALVVRTVDGVCHLVVDAGASTRVERIAHCGDRIHGEPLTADPSLFVRSHDQTPPRGRFERNAFEGVELLLFPGAVLDLRDLSVRRFTVGSDAGIVERVPPLHVSPDGASFVRLATDWGQTPIVSLVVITPGIDVVDVVPVDTGRTRYHDMDALDPAWVQHYFEWARDEGGVYRLVARADAVPLPYQGRLTRDGTGYREYRVKPALPSLRAAFIELLRADMGAELVAAEEDAYSHEVRIDGAVVSIGYRVQEHEMVVFMSRDGDTQLVATIAERFDAALRTGQYDQHFAL